MVEMKTEDDDVLKGLMIDVETRSQLNVFILVSTDRQKAEDDSHAQI